MTIKTKKDPGPFTPTYTVGLSLHHELPEKDRLLYEFRAATIAERKAERFFYDFINGIEDEDAREISIDQLAEDLLPLVSARLVAVKRGGDNTPDEMDIENRIDQSSLIELFQASYLHELPSIAQKKRSLLLSSMRLGGSAETAEDAPEPQTSKTESPRSNARSAEDKDGMDAQPVEVQVGLT